MAVVWLSMSHSKELIR